MRRNISLFISILIVSSVFLLFYEVDQAEIGLAPVRAVLAEASQNVHMNDPGTG